MNVENRTLPEKSGDVLNRYSKSPHVIGLGSIGVVSEVEYVRALLQGKYVTDKSSQSSSRGVSVLVSPYLVDVGVLVLVVVIVAYLLYVLDVPL